MRNVDSFQNFIELQNNNYLPKTNLRLQIFLDDIIRSERANPNSLLLNQFCKLFSKAIDIMDLEIHIKSFHYKWIKKGIYSFLQNILSQIGCNENLRKLIFKADFLLEGFSCNIFNLLKNCKNVMHLSMDSGFFTGLVEEFEISLENLREIQVLHNPLSVLSLNGSILLLKAISKQKNINSIDIQHSNLRNNGDFFTAMNDVILKTNLKNLNLSNNKALNKVGLSSINRSFSILSLNLSNVRLNSFSWGDNKSMQELYLKNCGISIDKKLMLNLPKSLVILDLSGNSSRFPVTSFDDFENIFPCLRVLKLNDNTFAEFSSLLHFVSQSNSLRELSVFEGSVIQTKVSSTDIVDAFVSSPSLQLADHEKAHFSFTLDELEAISNHFEINSHKTWNRTKSAR